MLTTLIGILGSGMAMSLGTAYGSAEGAWMALGAVCVTFGSLCAYGIMTEKNNKAAESKLLTKREDLMAITNKYNAVTQMLEDNYYREKRSKNSYQKEQLRQYYESQYYKNKAAYEEERQQFIDNLYDSMPETSKMRKFWKWVVTTGIIAQLSACGYSMGALSELEPESISSAVSMDDERLWNADNIPMPHLTDGTRYVSNPDGVVSENTERLLNLWLKKMDDSLQIESAMIIVNHVENEDVFRFAQDIFDKYHVGKDDRGLVVVLAYQDHKVRTHTGRSLEADLTDIECSRLQQDYAIPCMKAEQPDSGMLYLTEAIYNTLEHKELPTLSSMKEADNDDFDESDAIFFLYFLLSGGWLVLISYLKHRYSLAGTAAFAANPFARQPVIVVSSGGFGGGGGFSGGGGFGGGGGFSGGSSGGGGATSSW